MADDNVPACNSDSRWHRKKFSLLIPLPAQKIQTVLQFPTDHREDTRHNHPCAPHDLHWPFSFYERDTYEPCIPPHIMVLPLTTNTISKILCSTGKTATQKIWSAPVATIPLIDAFTVIISPTASQQHVEDIYSITAITRTYQSKSFPRPLFSNKIELFLCVHSC